MRRFFSPWRLLPLGIILCSSAGWGDVTTGKSSTQTARIVRVLRTDDQEVLRPAGVGFSARRGTFVVATTSRSGASRSNTLELMNQRDEHIASTLASLAITDPINVAYDDAHDRLLVVDAATNRLMELGAGARGRFDTDPTELEIPRWGPARLEGLALDPARGTLYALDRLGRRIVGFQPAAPGDVHHEERDSGAISIPLAEGIRGDLRGLAFDGRTRHFFLLSPNLQTLYEVSETGRGVGAIDVSSLALREPGGMVMAASGDPTDDPTTLSLYVAVSEGSADAFGGHLVEISLTARRSVLQTEATLALPLVRTIETWRWSPKCPDPSGITYDSVNNRLIVVDGEVEEMTIWAHANYFEMALDGTLIRTSDATRFTNEPVGAAFNPTNRHVIISDDDIREVFDVDLGSDQRFGTSDDRVTRLFDTRTFGCEDPEGVSYDPVGKRLFIADGLGSEIWEVRAGPNGVFEGSGDDVIKHFDATALGIHDPETVEYNPDKGTLYVIGKDAGALELTTDGSILNTLDLSAAHLRSPAGMAYAPNSTNPSRRSLYIVCRGTDNDSDPRENDGMAFEFDLDPGSPGGTDPPPSSDLTIRVAAGSDDAEESSTGSMTLTSGDLELVYDGNIQKVGLRFNNVAIPQGAAVASASIQFTADETQSESTTLQIQGHAADNAGTFTTTSGNVSSRPRTAASIAWSPSPWNTVGEAGSVQRTPNLVAVIQEIVNRPGWTSGNSLAFIITGSGHRTGVAYEGDAGKAPMLQIQLVPTNRAPVVDAGPNQTITLPADAVLDGTVSDDGLPNGQPTTTWSKESGPGSVTFVDSRAVDTRASFAAAGTYVLLLRANDGSLSGEDRLTVTVQAASSSSSGIDRLVAAGSDDAEESSTGSMILTSSDLELVYDGNIQKVGLRFNNIAIPRGTAISSAYIQFTADEQQTESTPLQIQGHAADNAGTFTTTSGNVSSRPRTSASVTWSPPAWNTVGEAGSAQRTPNLAAVIQEIVNRPGWASGNSLAFIINGSGHRTAVGYEGTPSKAPLLHIELGLPSSTTNQAPVVDAGPNQTITLPADAALDGTVSDDGLPNGQLTTIWSKESGPGSVTFADSRAVDTRASFSVSGTYVLLLQAQDGSLTGEDRVTITVQPTVPTASTTEIRVNASSDDAEEGSTGVMSLASTDLELVKDGTDQKVGMRFTGVGIPRGAIITRAYVQFQVDQAGTNVTALTVRGQAIDQAPTFTTTAGNVSGRSLTIASVPWTPPAWNTVGAAGADQRTPELGPVIQEIVNRPGWTSGNSLVIVITGTGKRTAAARDGNVAGAPLLHIEWGSAVVSPELPPN